MWESQAAALRVVIWTPTPSISTFAWENLHYLKLVCKNKWAAFCFPDPWAPTLSLPLFRAHDWDISPQPWGLPLQIHLEGSIEGGIQLICKGLVPRALGALGWQPRTSVAVCVWVSHPRCQWRVPAGCLYKDCVLPSPQPCGQRGEDGHQHPLSSVLCLGGTTTPLTICRENTAYW